MIYRTLFLLTCVVCLVACQKTTTLKLTSDSSVPVSGKRLVMQKRYFPDLKTSYFTLKDPKGELIPVQFDDMDGDGIWDEVAFECDFEPNGVLSLELTETEDLPDFSTNTNVYLGYSPERNNQFTSVAANSRPADHVALSTPYLYQYEGPGWESELVGFRTYFDSRNGKDIFGKAKPQLCVEQIGLGENYHEMQDWGMDVLKVGSSLGAGALAMFRGDSIYRLGDTETADFRIITEGPVRAVLQLKYGGWNVGGATYGLTETISIWAGKRSYESQVLLEGREGNEKLVTGIVDLKKVAKRELEVGGVQIMYTYGNQSENHDNLGMGILVKQDGLAGFSKAPEEGEGVINTYTALLNPVDDVYSFHFFVGWEVENGAFANQNGFEESLIEAANELNANISVELVK